jgi:hypothetical protein
MHLGSDWRSGEKNMKLVLTLAVVLALVLPVSGQKSVLHNFSERARNVTLVSLLEAQQRGTDTVDVNDLILALVIEDQDWDAVGLFDLRPPGGVPWVTAHKPFLPPKVAVDVLVRMNAILPRSTSLPTTTEMRTSAGYDRVLDAAAMMPSEFRQSNVKINFGRPDRPIGMYQAVVPLDLLAAALSEQCEGTKLLQEAGITEENVLQTIRAGGNLETGVRP